MTHQSQRDASEGVRRPLWQTMPLWGLCAVIVVSLLAAVALGATRGSGRPGSGPTALFGPLAPRTGATTPAPGPGLPLNPDRLPTPLPPQTGLSAAVAILERTHNARLGVAIVPVHRLDLPASPPWSAGTLLTGPAWSTIKVPIGVAIMRRSADPLQYRDLLDAAISRSDNLAADQLWSTLGTDVQASGAVTAELRIGGDATTVVPARPTRRGFSIAGQTQWALIDQARYAATLPCNPMAAAIVDRMTQVVPEQRWGLGQLPTTAFKGGWGPDAKGRYLVRQLGTLQLTDGSRLGVALAAQAADGSYAAGTELLTELAALLDEHAAGIGGGCDL